MEFKQIYTLMNSITKEILGDEIVVEEDLSNVVDIGNEVINASAMDKYVKTLVDHIGKVIFVNRPYAGSAPSVLMDGWEYGSILQKITYDGLPEATENETWELEDGKSYDPNIFTQPTVSSKFFSKRTTFEIPMSFAERQVKSAFDSVSQLNAFFSMIHDAIEKSMTVKTDGLVTRTINNMIAETLASSKPAVAVNLLELYKAKFPSEETLTAANCIYSPEFIRYASFIMKLYSDRMSKLSTIFNCGGKERFTSKDLQHIVLLAEFESAAGVYLQSDTFHNEFTALPSADSVPFWQGSGTDYAFETTSKIHVSTASGKKVEQGGILGIIFDRDALGVSNFNRRVTSDYNPKGEFYNNWFKADAGYFNDFNENFVVFYVDDNDYSEDYPPETPVTP
jgi:hypothetical protein